MSQLEGMTVGQYRLIQQIGRGGMATVYKAYQPSLDRMVAVKVLPATFAHDADFHTRFRREATSIARLRHPNILTVYDFGEDNGLTYIVMEYVSGGTLKEWLGRPLPLDWAAAIVDQIATALDYAHRQGIVHRDVKPANVLMAREDWALLSDFGVAKIVEGSTASITAAGVGIGTPEYMSPEQGQGGAVDGRSDIYALGVMLFHMLTGSLPYTADTPLAVVMKHITGPLPRPKSVNPAISDAVERVILKALARNPDDRYQTAGELAQALHAAARETAALQGSAQGPGPYPFSDAGAGTVVDAGQLPWSDQAPPQTLAPAKSSRTILYAVAAGVAVLLCLLAAGGGGIFLVAIAKTSSTPTATARVVLRASPTLPVVVRTPVAPTIAPTSAPAATSRPPTVAPTQPGSPRGAVLFSDDFAINAAGWHTNADENASRYLDGGKYHVTVSKLNWMGWGNPADQRLGDIDVEVTATTVDGPDANGYGILFRYVDVRNFYCLEFSASGSYRFHKKENDVWTTFIDWTSVKAVKTGREPNRLRLVAKGKAFTFYVNDTQLGSFSDGTFATGTIGLFASTYREGGVHVTFDDLKVWEAK